MIEPIIKLFSCPLFSPLPIKHPRGLITLYLMGGIQNTNINTAYTSHGQDNIVFWITKRYNIFFSNLKQISSTCFPSLNVIQGGILNCFWKTNGVRSKLDISLNRRISCTTHYMKVKLKQRLLRWRQTPCSVNIAHWPQQTLFNGGLIGGQLRENIQRCIAMV